MTINVSKIYENRFSREEVMAKRKLWEILVREFLQHYVHRDAVVVDLGGGTASLLTILFVRRSL